MTKEIIMAVGAGQSGSESAPPVPQAGNGEAKSPIPGISPELFQTLSQRHSPEFIKEKRESYPSEKAFLEDAEKEAEHIRITLEKQTADATSTLTPKPLSVGEDVNGKIVDKGVLENAQLWDTKRQEAAAKLLGKELSDKQKQELIEAHWESAGEKGQDKEHLAGVYNLTRKQIRREVEKLPSFTPEERRKLFEAGLVGGSLPPSEFSGFDVTPYKGTPLESVAEELFETGTAGEADEVFLKGVYEHIQRMVDEGKIPYALAKALKKDANALRLKATELSQPERVVPPEVGRQPSLFEQTLFNIVTLQGLPDSPEKTAKLDTEITNLNEILKQANGAGLFQIEKPELYELLRTGRIDVSIREKREGSKLGHISTQKTRSEQTSVETDAFWNDPRYPQRRELRAFLGGSVDYFVRGSKALIESVAKNPRIKDASGNLMDIRAVRDYSDLRQEYAGIDGIIAAWTYQWKNGDGLTESANNFEEMRQKLEQERAERPKFMIQPFYGTVEFFADDMSELGLATRDFVRYAVSNLPKGEAKAMLDNLKGEQSIVQRAFKEAVLFFKRNAEDPTVKWISSEMNSVFGMAGAGYFQRRGEEGLEGFQYFANSWTEGLRVADTSVNYEDALTLDEDGMFLYIAEQLCKNDGEFYRFGSSAVPGSLTVAEMNGYLDKRRSEIIEEAASHRLKSIGDSSDPENWLLKPYETTDPDHPLNLSDPDNPLHKLFGKLKAKFDEIDAEDVRAGKVITQSRWDEYKEKNQGSIPKHRAFAQLKAKCDLKDAEEEKATGARVAESRWDIYQKEAKKWEDFAGYKAEDLRDPRAKVKFIHPLARNLRNDQEFADMYKEIAVTDERRKRATYLIKRVEDYLRFNMIDVRSGSARIKYREKGPDGRPILNGKVERVEAYTNVLRNELRRTMAMDEGKSPLDKRFKATYILQQLGYKPEMPVYGLFALGADDTIRNQAIERHFRAVPEFEALFNAADKKQEDVVREVNAYRAMIKQRNHLTDAQVEADPEVRRLVKLYTYIEMRMLRGAPAKTIIVKFLEDERLAVQAVQRAIRHPDNRKYGNNGGDYDNFPGEDNPNEEGGTKFWKNLLYFDFGISRGTVRVNGMIPFMNSGVLDRISELGGWSPKYITGLRHRGDEIELADNGALVIDPKETRGYLTRLMSLSKKRPLLTSVGDTEKKPGAMFGGFIQGAFRLRELGVDPANFTKAFTRKVSENVYPRTVEEPEMALEPEYLAEHGKKAYLELIASVFTPTETVMRENQKLETAYGPGQDTAKDMNTLLFHDLSYWMDNNWEEFSGDNGFAVDAMLHMARKLAHTHLKESGLIWPERAMGKFEGWTRIADRLIKDLPEDLWDGVPVGSSDLIWYPDKEAVKTDKTSIYSKAPTRDKKVIRENILRRLREEIRRGI